MAWMVEEVFQFPLELEAQGANKFLELHGNNFPSLVREFYSNIQYKNRQYTNLVRSKNTRKQNSRRTPSNYYNHI
ncbi:hypothetical protein Lal_00030192 [Lupinus albus]|nr:hypothetical protein Lal_00030192 [Lupinus albus]